MQVLLYYFFISLDVDECSASDSLCDLKADCKNTLGSYRCLCKPGFTGDGRTCSGRSTLYVLYRDKEKM